MPFDAFGTPIRQRSLCEILADHGIQPVSLESLVLHKQKQARRFAPSVWYRYQALLPIDLLGSIALLFGAAAFRVRAGSHWEERPVAVGWLDDLGVPEPIAEAARTACREVPGSALIMGELIREKVVLDPYLLLEYDGELVCLGIWEGGRIVACAGFSRPIRLLLTPSRLPRKRPL